MPKVSGFTIVRNALKLSYPFLESVRSGLALCDEYIIACGKSDDATRALCAQLEAESPDKIRILETEWSRDKQSGGFQLKHQSDLAMRACTGDWCLYVQADEVLHEADYPAIRKNLLRANERPEIDGLVFDYCHFYGGYDYEIRGRNWYRREVRLFKNGRGIEAFRDAQGFRRSGQRLNVLPAQARVFHYGYVRTPDSLGTKSAEMAQWWGDTLPEKPPAETLHRHFGLRRFRATHPALMRERIAHTPPFDPTQCTRKWDWNEIKNAMTLVFESVVPVRLGEFRNYEITR